MKEIGTSCRCGRTGSSTGLHTGSCQLDHFKSYMGLSADDCTELARITHVIAKEAYVAAAKAYDERKHVDLEFGTGRLFITGGKGDVTCLLPEAEFIVIQQTDEPHLVDVPRPDLAGAPLADYVVKMTFGNVQSLDALIHVLQDYRDMKLCPK